MSASSELTIFVRRENDIVLVQVAGDITPATVDQLRRALTQSLQMAPVDVDVDFTGVTSCDAAGLAALVEASAALTRQGRRLAVRTEGGLRHEEYLLAGLARSLHVDARPEEAALAETLRSDSFAVEIRTVLDASLSLVVTMAQSVVGSADGASITLPRDGRLTTVASSNDVVLQMDHDQYETGEGPCLDAATRGERFEIRSLDAEARWPRFVPRARARGIASILSTPMLSRGRSLGALNIYSRNPAAFAEHETRWADEFAAEAAEVVRTATVDASPAATQEQIRHAVESREIIARAEGALMAHDHLTEERARTVLRQVARSTRRPLRTVSQELLADLSGRHPARRRASPSDDDPAPGTTSSSGLGGSADEGPPR